MGLGGMTMARQQLTPEILVPRLGEYLVQSGLITEADLKKALEYQKARQKSRHPCLLGDALVELKVLERADIDQAITEQILQLRNALEDANRYLERRVQERTYELEEALRKLSELNQLKANFIANISHELRTPMTHIKGYLELLVTEALGDINEDQKKALTVSQRASIRLEGLIEGLILFSLASRGEMTLKLGPVYLNYVSADVLNYTHSKASDRKVKLKVDMPADLPPVRADEEKITWTLLQLIDNAIKFTPAEGQVSLSASLETEGLVMVQVSDTGIGIPQERINEIFEPFHQLDGSSTRRYGGTGLGLALVKEILNAHGSMIEVESQEGKGTTFKFPLVVAEAVERSN
jgi:signal transduction histidine kinase